MKNIHMMGIGGIGMSAIARLLLERGESMSGCDTCLNPLTERLKSIGAVIYEGHSPQHINDSIDLVVHTSAIKSDHPELVKAKEYSIPVMRRAQMLAEVIKDKSVIAVTGTHGKTTTSFMIAHIMDYAGLEPGFAIGGEMEELGGNARWGQGRYFVVEADESDGTQVCIKPDIAVITNIDCDHMEHYSDISHIADVMQEFIAKMPKDGLVIGCGEWPEVSSLLKRNKVNPVRSRKKAHSIINNIFDGTNVSATSNGVNSLSYGCGAENDICATDIELSAWSSKFNLWCKGIKLGMINLNIPGRHNVLNAIASAGVCMKIGIPFDKIAEALSKYPGVKRRLDVVFQNDEVIVMDDYAHHPNEIKAVINTVRKMVHLAPACRGEAPGRLIGVFQPHRFTRTKLLAVNFGDCFIGLDKLILTDIYSAGEPPIAGVTGRLIYDNVVKRGNPEVVYIESKDSIMEYLLPQIRRGDTILFMGAGDITEIAHQFPNWSVAAEEIG